MRTIGTHRIRHIIAILALTFAASGSAARTSDSAPATYRWTNVTVGGGGYAPNIVFSPVEPGLAYLRTDMGGAYRWDARAGRWIPLQDDIPVSSYMGIESIAADPRDAKVVYLAAGMYARDPAAILRSADRGATWRVTRVPFAMGANEAGRGLGERLAIDPNQTSTLFFGSRHDGLWRSDNAGATWAKVARFPIAGLGAPADKQTHGGVSFVAVDPASGAAGQRSRRIWAGVADPGADHLFRSDDGGDTWTAVKGPGRDMLAAKGVVAAEGTLYVGFASGIGPSDATSGAVWRFAADGTARDITPAGYGSGGFLGLAIARDTPGMVAVSTIDRWQPGDTVWLSRDGGAQWDDLGARSRRDVTPTPFLLHEGKGADFGHWISGLAIDPFDSRHLAYTTGATLYAADAVTPAGPILWTPWTKGVEQTAIVTLAAPTGGAPLLSGFGDIAGFVHADLDQSPQPTFSNPYLSNTNTIDYAGRAPNIVVRSGSLYTDRPRDATLGWSDDGGLTWHPLKAPAIRPTDDAPGKRYDLEGDAAVIVSADGGTFIVCTPVPLVTRDRGRTWALAQGLRLHARPVADKVDPQRFYSVDFDTDRLLVSSDGAKSFAPVAARGLPPQLWPGKVYWREQQYRLVASPFAAGDLWFHLGEELYHSNDGGLSFRRANGALRIEFVGLGKPAPGATVAAIYAVGTLKTQRGVWRSIDEGKSWARINDDAHQYGGRFRVIGGDPRRFGRVYVGTDGRGILYGDPVGETQ